MINSWISETTISHALYLCIYFILKPPSFTFENNDKEQSKCRVFITYFCFRNGSLKTGSRWQLAMYTLHHYNEHTTLQSYYTDNIYRGYYTAVRRYEFYFRVVKYCFLPREYKTYIFKPPCNFLFIDKSIFAPANNIAGKAGNDDINILTSEDMENTPLESGM